ncbi:MAG TPA: YoaK family protein [Planctomycetaceae bacterium]|nr:YoaK family protein [Planctomycetaceae bacterium]
MVERRSSAIRNGLLLVLAFTAGYIDALSYLGLGRVFTANMTGNTVLLGIALAQFDGDAIARAGLALAGFVAGAAAGAWIVERDHSDSLWPWSVTLSLILESLLLLAFAAVWYVAQDPLASATTTAALIVLSALAMGVQSAAVRRLEITGIATTYLTGTLTNLVSLLMGRSRRKSKPFQHSVLLATVWIVYIGGTVSAAVDLPRNLVLTLVFPVALIMAVILIATIVFRPR